MIEKDPEKFFLSGIKPVLELLEREPQRVDQVLVRRGKATADSSRLLDLCRAAKVRFSLVPEAALARLTGAVHHQGVIARLRETGCPVDWQTLLEQTPDAPLPLVVALDQVQDPGNVGTLIRTLYSLGGAGLLLPRHNSAFLGPGARRSAAGTLERLPLAMVTNLSRAVQEANEAGFTTYAAGLSHAADQECLNALASPLVLPALLVLGNEDRGIRPGVARHCHFGLNVPFLRDFDSLNVAQAGAILISCFLRLKQGT